MLLAPGLQSSRVWVAAPALGLAQGSGLPGRLRCGVTAPRSLIGSGPLDPQPANKASCDSRSIIDWLGQASLFPHREHCAALSVYSAPAGCSQFAPAELCDRPKQRRTAVGPQNFIFVSLNRFGSLINVTITITRKFFTILLSVIVYGHHVRAVACRAVPCRAHLFACADATAERAVVTLQQHWTDSATGERNAVGNGCDGLRRHPIA